MPTPDQLEQYPGEKQKFRKRLEAEGHTEVRRKAALGFYVIARQEKWAREWLREQERAEEKAVKTDRREQARKFPMIMCFQIAKPKRRST